MSAKLLLTASEFTQSRLADGLRACGAQLLCAEGPAEALVLCERENVRVILIEAPGADCSDCSGGGCSLPGSCARLSRHGCAALIALSQGAAERRTICALNAGVDDCVDISEPISALRARARAWLRRAERVGVRVPALQAGTGALRLETERRRATVGSREISLTPREFDLLTALARYPGVTRRRSELLDEVWGPGVRGRSRTLDVHIGRLRIKVEPDPADPRLIVTVPGIGYRLEPAAADAGE